MGDLSPAFYFFLLDALLDIVYQAFPLIFYAKPGLVYMPHSFETVFRVLSECRRSKQDIAGAQSKMCLLSNLLYPTLDREAHGWCFLVCLVGQHFVCKHSLSAAFALYPQWLSLREQ